LIGSAGEASADDGFRSSSFFSGSSPSTETFFTPSSEPDSESDSLSDKEGFGVYGSPKSTAGVSSLDEDSSSDRFGPSTESSRNFSVSISSASFLLDFLDFFFFFFDLNDLDV